MRVNRLPGELGTRNQQAQNSEKQEIFREVKTLKAQDHSRPLRPVLVRKQEVCVCENPDKKQNKKVERRSIWPVTRQSEVRTGSHSRDHQYDVQKQWRIIEKKSGNFAVQDHTVEPGARYQRPHAVCACEE